MPITAAELAARLDLDTTGFIAGLRHAHSEFKILEKSLSGQALSAFGNKLTSVGQTLSVAVTAPLALLAVQAIRVGISYEQAMNVFQATTRATGAEMAKVAEVAQKLGADLTLPKTSAADAALAMTELAKGGLTASQAMDAARGTLELAAAATLSEAEAARLTSTALNAFGLAAGEAGKVADLLAAAANASSAEISDVGLAMQQSSASAAALKIPVDDLVAGIGLMANAGIRGSDAGTSLKTMMLALTPTTDKAAAAMKQLGIDAFDSQGKFVGLEDIIKQAAPALAKMTDEQRQLAIRVAFGSDAQRSANVILGAGVEKWNAMDAAVNRGGAAQELAAAKTKGLGGAIEGLVSQLETLAIKFFERVGPALERIVKGLGSLADWFGKLPAPVQNASLAILGLAALAGPVALFAGKVIGSIAAIRTALVSLQGGAVSAKNALAQLTVSMLAFAQRDMSDVGKKAADVFARAGAGAKKAGADVNDYISHMNELAFVAGKGQKASGGLAESLKGVGTAAGGGGGGGGAAKGVSALAAALESVNRWSSEVGPKLQFTEQILKSMTASGRANVLALSAAFVTLKNSITLMGAELAGGQGLDAGVRAAFDKLIAKSKETATTIVAQAAKISTVIISLPFTFKSAFDRLKTHYDDLDERARRSAANVIAQSQRIHDALLESFDDLGRQLPQSWNLIIDGILNGSGRLGDELVALGVNIKGWAGDIIGVVDTLPGHFGDVARKVLKTVDQWVQFGDKVLALLNRLSGGLIPDSISGLVEMMVEKFKTGFDSILGSFKSFGNSMLSGIKSLMSAGGGLGQLLVGGGLIAGGVASGSRALGGLMGAAGGALTGAKIGSLIAPGIGTAVGAVGGAIVGGLAGIFGGGKNAAQKAQEAAQKKAAEVQTAQAIANLSAGIMDGLEKGRQLLEGLATFVEVPKQAIKKFFKQLENLLVSFVEMSAQFNSEGLAKAKEVADNLGPVFSFLAAAVDFSRIARELEDISDETIATLMSAISRLEAGFEGVIAKMETSTVKRAARLAERMMHVFGFISIIPETLKGLNESPDVSDEVLAKVFASATRIIDRFGELTTTFEVYATNKLAKSSKQFADIFTSISAIVGGLKSIGEYSPMPEGALDGVTSDLQRVVTAISGWVDLGMTALSGALNLEDVVRRLHESLGRSFNSLGNMAKGGGEALAMRAGSGGTVVNRQQSTVNNYHFGGQTFGDSDPGAGQIRQTISYLRMRTRQA